MASKKFIRVDEWRPSKADLKVQYSGKLIVIPFDKLFDKQDNDTLNNFIIKKESYAKRLDDITHYINYFIKFYDTDNELLMAYLKLKYLIDNKEQNLSINLFIKLLYNILLSDTMVKKIINMVEDNYYVDLSANTGIKYNESLEFTNEHAKIMMQISVSMKLMVPVVFHYLNAKDLLRERHYLFRCYEGLFDLYGDNVDIYNKLWLSIFSKVNVNQIRNRLIWEQREIFGTTVLTQLEELLKDKIISESMFKYTFDKNIISFNYVVLREQLRFFLAEPYKQNRIELSIKKDNATGLSGLDKLEMNSSKIDESIVILSDINIKKTIKRIQNSMHIKPTKDEINFYRDNTYISEFQSQLVFYYYAKYFSGYRDLNLLNRTQYFKLLIILKKRLQYQKFIYLPQILTANIESRLNSRTIRNDKFLTKIESSSIYQHILSEKYSTLDDIGKPDMILNLLSTILNTTFTFVDYDHPETLGRVIELNQDVVSDEFLNFLNQF